MRKNKKQIRDQYNAMLDMVAKGGYDGRGNVDVYICKNGHRFYTEYIDKGVTPFCMVCRLCSDEQQPMTATRSVTISKHEAIMLGVEIHQWVRPTLEQTYLLTPNLKQHVLDGGLLLMEDIIEYCGVHGAFNKLAKAFKDPKRPPVVWMLLPLECIDNYHNEFKEIPKGV